MNRKTMVFTIGFLLAFCLGLHFYAEWNMAQFEESLPQPPAVQEQQETTTDDINHDTAGGHWHGDEWHADDAHEPPTETELIPVLGKVEPVEFDEPIDYELNPHLLNVKIYSDDDELTRIMVEKERARIRATDPELDAFLVEKDEIDAEMEKNMAVLAELDVQIAKGIWVGPAVKAALEEGRKLQARSADWLARFRARYGTGEDN